MNDAENGKYVPTSIPRHSLSCLLYSRSTTANRVKYLSRVAAEYTQLVYRASKARDEKCAFVDTVQWVRKLSSRAKRFTNVLQRIDRIRSTLSSDLDHAWAFTLTAFTEGKATEIEKLKLIADMTECLRTYDALELWKDAEEVIRKEVVRKFVKKVRCTAAMLYAVIH